MNSDPTPHDVPAPRRFVALASGLIALAVCLVYAGSFSVPLLLDDTVTIAANPSIHQLWPLEPVLMPPSEMPSSGRPLLNFSFALNYAIGGTAVRGYHVVNLLLHMGAALALFGVVRRALLLPKLRDRFGARAGWLALAVALAWALHPLQTEAVTYISQRAEVLMGLCYLLTLYGFIRGASGGRRGWLIFSVAICAAGMTSKEVMITAPLLVWLFDRAFVAGTLRAAWAQRGRYYLALASTWVLLGFLLMSSPLAARGVGFGGGFTWWKYAVTECEVLVRYVKLCGWPHPLVFDYGAETLPPTWGRTGACASLLAALVMLTLLALRRRSALGFLGGAFFLILAPTSSVVPVALQPMAESRLYLPLAAVVTAAVLGGASIGGRKLGMSFFASAIGLGVLTVCRNADYASAVSIWRDTVAKVSGSSRAQNFYGMSLPVTTEALPEAIAHYEAALRIRPDFPEAHNNLANALLKIPGRAAEAQAHFEAALRFKPDYAEVHVNLGNLFSEQPGRLLEAVAHYEQALRIKPGLAEAHNNLANALLKVPDRLPDALAHYEAALRLKPDYFQAHNNYGHALTLVPGHMAEAIAHFEMALRFNSNYALAHFNLGMTLAEMPERRADAIAHLTAAVRLRPELEPARQMLAQLGAMSAP